MRVHAHDKLAGGQMNRPIQSRGHDLPRVIDDRAPRITLREFIEKPACAIRAHAVRDDDVENQIRTVQPHQTFHQSPNMGNLIPAGDYDSYVQVQKRG